MIFPLQQLIPFLSKNLDCEHNGSSAVLEVLIDFGIAERLLGVTVIMQQILGLQQ